jgi:hypothetical protein
MRYIGLVVAGFDNLVNLAIKLLLVEIVDLTLAWASVGEIFLAIHMSFITSCH